MQYRLMTSLGTDDARRCNKEFGTKIPLNDSKALAIGAEIELTKEAVEWLTGPRGKGLTAMLEPVTKTRGEVAPAK